MCSLARTVFALVIPLLCWHAAAISAKAQSVDLPMLMMQGGNLTADQAAALERELQKNPDDLDIRCKVLAYYIFNTRRRSPEGRAARAKHILWIIEHHPEARIARFPDASSDAFRDRTNYGKAKELWLKQVEKNPTNPAILGNAGVFFLMRDRARAEELLSKAQDLEPENSEWAQHLGHLYSLNTYRSGTGVARKALKAFEQALKHMSPDKRYYLLVDLAKAAFTAGELEKARKYASELLDRAVEQRPIGNYGNAVHHGNLILGRVALAEGKVEEAETYLLRAGKTPGSPTLNSFGPKMQLALELLQQGRKKAVIEYLKLCGKFWKRYEIDDWIAEIEKDLIPGFGGNLRY